MEYNERRPPKISIRPSHYSLLDLPPVVYKHHIYGFNSWGFPSLKKEIADATTPSLTSAVGNIHGSSEVVIRGYIAYMYCRPTLD